MPHVHITRSRDLPVGAEHAWAVIADYSLDPTWRHGVVSMTIEPPGPAAVGSTTVEDLRFGGKQYRNVGEIVEVEPMSTIRWRTVEGADADGQRRVEPLADGTCRVTLELRVRPTGVERLLAPLLARMLARTMRGDLERLAAMLGTARTDLAAATGTATR